MNSSGDLPKRPKLSWFPNAVIIFILMAAMGFKFWANAWQKKVIENDVISYYAYLPALFIHHDITLDFMNDTSTNYQDRFWPQKLDNGKYVIKTSMGMSILYAPFFGLAHAYETATGGKATGYTSPYRVAISFAGLLFLLLGLIMTRKLLRKHFTPLATGLTLLLIFFATNLFHYSTREPGMTHVYNFGLIALFLWANDRWLEKTTTKNTILIGLLFGIITLVRPTNAMILIFPFLWKVSSWSGFKERLVFMSKSWSKILIIAFSTFLVWLPQLLYWKMQSGSYFINSYGESFYFGSNHFAEALFGFRKGWYIYNPVMLIATIGFLFLVKKFKGALVSTFFFLCIFIFVTFSWWCWWYGGSLGGRAMIDTYAVMALPLAAILQAGLTGKMWRKVTTIVMAIAFMYHGFFQTKQYFYGAIHWDSMTKESYMMSFGKLHPVPAYWYLLQQPDYDNAIQGHDEVFASKTQPLLSDSTDFTASFSKICPLPETEYYNLVNLCMPDTSINTSGKVFISGNDFNVFPNDLTITASLYRGNEVLQFSSIEVGAITGGGRKDAEWSFDLKLADFDKKGLTIKIFLWTKSKAQFQVYNIDVVLDGIKSYVKEI